MSAVVGGFTGGDALLALATIQQDNMNARLSESMLLAKSRSEMASDLADIKSHLETANRNPARFEALDTELQAFMDKYGSVPELEEVTLAVKEIADNLHGRLAEVEQGKIANGNGYGKAYADWVAAGSEGMPPERQPDPVMTAYAPEQVDNWLELLTSKLDASGTNDQLDMIGMKQLNDDINNNSGMVSGIIESRNNATAAIINNFA